MSVKVVAIASLGNVRLSQNLRSRRIRLSVKPGQDIVVSFPFCVTFREAICFAEKHAEWIKAQQKKFETSLPKFQEDSTIRTRFHEITFRGDGGNFGVEKILHRITICYPQGVSFEDQEVQRYIRKVLTEVYRGEAKRYLPGRVAELALRHGFRHSRLTIRNNRSNWGSCSGNNNINLNLHLMKLPDPLIDFIILHELVHTRIKNHSPAFWEMLGALREQARQLTREIKKYRIYS